MVISKKKRDHPPFGKMIPEGVEKDLGYAAWAAWFIRALLPAIRTLFSGL